MNDDAAFALAWSVLPGAAAEPTRHTPDPLRVLAAARRDRAGVVTVWPTCSRSGNPSALAQVVDPIDPLAPQDDTQHLVTLLAARLHDAQVLAYAVTEPDTPDRFMVAPQQALW